VTGLVFSSVVFAALLHAGWNALVKTGQNKQSGMLLLTLAHAFFGLCILPFVSLPQGTLGSGSSPRALFICFTNCS